MATLSMYLNFAGTTEEAFQFYKSVFGGEFVRVERMKGAPGTEQLPVELQNKIMYIGLQIDKNTILHGTDAMEEMGHPLTMGNNFSIMLEGESKDEVTRLYTALSAGGTVTMPLQDMFWGAYYGQLTDRFGVQWMVTYNYPA